MDRFEELLSGYLDSRLSAREEEELAALVRESEGLRRELADIAGIDGLLRAEFAPERLDEELLARISVCLVAPEREEETARRVVERISRRRTPAPRRLAARGARSLSRVWRSWLAAAACAALAIGAWFVFGGARGGSSPELVASGPDVTILRGGQELSARAGLALLPGDRLRTGREGGATIRWEAEGARIVAGRLTELAVSPGGGEARGPEDLEVPRGEVEASFSARRRGRPFRLASPHAAAEILGTELSLVVDRVATHLEVSRGRVRFTRGSDGASVEVRAGFLSVAAPGAELEPRPVTGPRVREGLAALYQFNEGGGAKVLDVAPAGSLVDVAIDDEAAVRWFPSALSFELPARARADGLALRAGSGLTLEAWVTPSEMTADGWWGRACFLSVWDNTTGWGLALGQGAEYGRSSASAFYVLARGAGGKGEPGPALEAASPRGTARPVHVAATIASGGETRLYLDGEEVSRTRLSPVPPEAREFALSLGSERSGESPWLGRIHMIAVYDRALSPPEVARNFACGVD